jgi:heavy metal translocating P-type ATPase
MSIARTCQHCGLATACAGDYCCFGCELAGRVAAEGADQRTEHYAVITFSLLLSMVVMMLSLFLFAEDVYGAGPEAGLGWMRKVYRVAAAVLSTPVVLMLGVPLARRALRGLSERRLTMDLLVCLGALAAYGVSIVAVLRGASGVYFDSATSALLLSTLGRYLEATARASAARVLGPSLKLGATPVLAAIGDAELARMSPAEVTPGMRVVIGVDEVLPVDAVLAEGPNGATEVELTLGVLTGAAAPVTRRVGDEIPAGAVPVSGPLHGIALRPARASTLERLAALSKSLEERPTRLQRLADAFAGALVPVVTALALATLGFTLMRASLDKAVIASLAVVLAACPCTYGVATPLVLWLALRKGLEKGVCVRNAGALEELAAVKTVAFDKTGTLTQQELAVLGADLAAGVTRADIDPLVAALEDGSRHPVALALGRWSSAAPAPLRERRIVVGCGVEGCDAAGRRVLLGAPRWLAGHGIDPWQGCDDDRGDVRVALAQEGRILARFRIGEAIRVEAAEAIATLAGMGVGAIMLTGDTGAGARAVAEPLRIEAHGDLSPEQKLERLAKLGKSAAMVGDGVNDAPALAAIGPSFAMEGGAGLARGMAQVTLLRDDLRLVPWTIALSRRAMQVGWQNLVASTVYNLFFLGLAATGTLRPVWAGLSMLTSSLLTLGSSLRVSAFPDPEAALPGMPSAAAALPAVSAAAPGSLAPAPLSPTTDLAGGSA